MTRGHPVRPHLRAWRLHVGRTLESLANELGTSHTSVQRWESGRFGVDAKTFEAIAKAYGITASELSAPPEDAPRAQTLHRILSAVRDLDDESLAIVAQLAERLKAV